MHINKNEWPLLIVCSLYAIAVSVSLLLTIYVVAMWRLALPSYDVVDHHVFLAAAALGEMDWNGLWERHNGAHLIVLPKLIFWLDMRLVKGQGWLVTATSTLAITATLIIIAKKIQRVKFFSAVEKLAFIMLLALMFSSVLLAESLLNPIDIQWSLLALGSVLLASSLDDTNTWSINRITLLLSGVLVSWLSAAPIFLMFTSVVFVLLLTHPNQYWKIVITSVRFLGWLLLFVVLMVAWEMLAMRNDWPLLLVQFYKLSAPESQWIIADAYLRDNPAVYGQVLNEAVVYMARFILVPLGHKWPIPMLITLPILIWLGLLWRSVRHWHADQRFFIYLTVFSLLLACAAGAFRFFTLYNYRHANMGFLLLLSSLLLIYCSASWSKKNLVLSAVMLGYMAFFMVVVVDEAGAWSYEGRNVARFLQIGDALGVRDSAKFAPVWKDDAANREAVDHSRTIFQQQRVGVYGSSAFLYYKGEKALPKLEVACQHRLLGLARHTPDLRAFALSGETRTADGDYLTQVLFLNDGINVGWADAQMPSDKLWEQWMQPWQWGGHVVFDGPLPAMVQVVVFDQWKRCQPWLVSLPQKN